MNHTQSPVVSTWKHVLLVKRGEGWEGEGVKIPGTITAGDLHHVCLSELFLFFCCWSPGLISVYVFAVVVHFCTKYCVAAMFTEDKSTVIELLEMLDPKHLEEM